MFGSNLILADEKTAIINEYHTEKATHRCTKCGEALYHACMDKLVSERDSLVAKIQKRLPAIPIVSLQAPQRWEYSVKGLVTAQSTTGTGVFAEFTSAFTDLFGAQSKVYNQKLKGGEDICKSILRKEALELGANAVVAVDIDYAEVGGEKGMLMVCMTGTAVEVQNPEIFGESAIRSLEALTGLKARLDHLAKLKPPAL
jgi:uncharacterized protein YbjQ (UPF0145 family)